MKTRRYHVTLIELINSRKDLGNNAKIVISSKEKPNIKEGKKLCMEVNK